VRTQTAKSAYQHGIRRDQRYQCVNPECRCEIKGRKRLELSNFCLRAISAASNSPGDGLLAAFEHIPHLLDGTPARSPQLAPGATRGVGNPISSVFAGLGGEQERQSDSHSKTNQQTQYCASL